jgi:hypothetical protein
VKGRPVRRRGPAFLLTPSRRSSLRRPGRRHGPANSVTPSRLAGEQGFVGGFEGLLFGFLIFLVGTLIVAHAWAVVDTKFAVVEAAKQAARTYVEAPSAAVAGPEAQQAADQALAGYGRDPQRASVSLASGEFGRCQRITIEVSYPAPILELPVVGRVGTGQSVRADHSELVDPYRTGLPGTSSCA